MILNVQYLEELMRERGWTERQLALKSGISSSTISRILNGKRNAGTRTITAIRRVFPKEPIDKLFVL